MSELQAKIRQFGDQKDLVALQEYVEHLGTDELMSFIKEHILLRTGILTWNYLLQSFTDSSESHNKRYTISVAVLQLIEEGVVSNAQSNAIVTRLRLELPKFKSHHLIEICNSCIEKIQRGNVMCTKDIPLTKEEHLQVVTKLGFCMEKLTCDEIPAFTYQLLKLCSTQNSRNIFLRLQYYFSNRVYKKLGPLLEPSTDSTDLDEISDASEHNTLQAESTVLYHIHNSAMHAHGSIKEYINFLKNMCKAPEFVLHPFQLTVLLTISTVSIFEDQVLEIIKNCMVRLISEDLKKSESAWFNDMTIPKIEINNIISVVIENSLKERQLAIAGLIHLGFILLSVNVGVGNKHIAQIQWELGTFILLKVMKKKREVSSTIIQQLCNKIIVGQNISHLTECLHQMCRNLTLTMLENQTIIIQLIEQILIIPGLSSRHIINSILPLIKVSLTIRDNLILILRKALYSRKIETRQMAACGFLKLLKSLRISSLAALSQSNSSASSYSFLTQISLDCQAHQSANKFSNEALCLEVLGILRRCFIQQAEVREELYEGLYDAVCMNSELGIPVLDMLWVHFNQYYNNEEDALPPLLLPKIVVSRNVDVLLQEPLGQLIYVIGLIVTKLLETHDTSHPSIARFTNVLQSLSDRMSKCELIHFELENGGDLLDTSPESQKQILILKQCMSIYEALMGFLISSWSLNSENTAHKINCLFQGYSRLVDFSKNLSKPKKVDGSKKTKSDAKNKAVSIRTKLLKPTKSVLDFQITGKVLSLLHEPTVSWTNLSQTNILKVKREFHRYVLNVILQLVNDVKTSKCIETTHTKPYFQYCTDIATVLFERVVKRLNYSIDFDCTTSVLALECFHAILSLVVHYYKEKINTFFSSVGKKSKNNGLGDLIIPFIETYQNFIMNEEIELSDDPEGKKLPVIILNTYTLLVSTLPYNGVHAAKVLDWLKHYADDNIMPNKQTGNLLIVLLLNMHLRCKSASSIYENIAIRLSDIMGTVNHDKPECPVMLKIINEGTALSALNSLAGTLKTMLNEVDWIIQRIQAENRMIIFSDNEKIERRKEQLKGKERDLCCYLCQIINICSFISNMAVPSGTNVEIIFKILIQLYNTLNSLTKYFLLCTTKINPNFQDARFERLVKLSGKPLTTKVYEFILYIEEGQQPNEDSTELSRKNSDSSTLKSRVLRETRLIPKLVYEMEQFGKNVIKLSKKHNSDLSKYVGIGISRDFRIKLPALKDALERLNVTINSDHSTISTSVTDDEVANRECDSDEMEQNQVDTSTDVDMQDATDTPPKKKSKKSK
ncbi:Fanconi anemia complementation group I [Carabus blaptoides fortunei]